MSLCHKLWIYNLNIFGTQCCKYLIFQTYIIRSNRIHSLKYLRSTTLESKDIGFRKAEFVAKTQFLWHSCISISRERNIRKTFMGRNQELKWLAFSIYSLSFFLYSPFNIFCTYQADHILELLGWGKHYFRCFM